MSEEYKDGISDETRDKVLPLLEELMASMDKMVARLDKTVEKADAIEAAINKDIC